MFATVRRYVPLAASAVDELADQAVDVRSVLAGVPGFADAHLIRTRDGLIFVAIGEDEATVVEVGRRFVAWIDRHVPAVREAPAAEVWAGDVLPTTVATWERDDADGPRAAVGDEFVRLVLQEIESDGAFTDDATGATNGG